MVGRGFRSDFAAVDKVLNVAVVAAHLPQRTGPQQVAAAVAGPQAATATLDNQQNDDGPETCNPHGATSLFSRNRRTDFGCLWSSFNPRIKRKAQFVLIAPVFTDSPVGGDCGEVETLLDILPIDDFVSPSRNNDHIS